MPLYLYNGALLLKNNALAAAQACCCGGGLISIEICNSNSITDDDWEVRLNGTVLGTHTAPENNILKGTVFRSNSGIPGDGCGVITYIDFPQSIVRTGVNDILMTITALYLAGNFGTITVNKWQLDANTGQYIKEAVLLSSTYRGDSVIGFTNSFSFTFP